MGSTLGKQCNWQLTMRLLRGIEGYFAKNPPLARNRAI
jgi:hypothetical protein